MGPGFRRGDGVGGCVPSIVYKACDPAMRHTTIVDAPEFWRADGSRGLADGRLRGDDPAT